MKFGICTALENASYLKEIGYDYFEFGFSKLCAMTDEEFAEFKEKVYELDFYPEAMNGMLAKQWRLTGEETCDLKELEAFLEIGLDRAKQVKTEVIVFGSSPARNLPEGFTDYAKAYAQLTAYLKMVGPIAEKNGIKIAIEPLRFAESNIVNFVSEGAYLAARANHPAIRCLADYYHMTQNEEDVEDIVGFAHRMEHCHIARNEGRKYPLPEDGQDYGIFFEALRKAGYDKRVSIEGRADDFEADAKQALAHLKSYV